MIDFGGSFGDVMGGSGGYSNSSAASTGDQRGASTSQNGGHVFNYGVTSWSTPQGAQIGGATVPPMVLMGAVALAALYFLRR